MKSERSYPCHKCPPPVPILGKTNPIQSFHAMSSASLYFPPTYAILYKKKIIW